MISKVKSDSLRIKVVVYLTFIIAFVIVIRLFLIQVIDHNYYEALASEQHEIYKKLVPERGKIFVQDKYSSELYPIATNKTKYLIYAIPKEIQDYKDVASKLAPKIEMKEEEVEKILSDDPADPYDPIKHKIEEEKKNEIEKLNLPGIKFQEEEWRNYPEGSFASHILGFVGFDNEEKKGQYGIEGYYEDKIKGESGFLNTEQDALGNWISVGKRDLDPATNGDDVVLTIDRTVQYKVEQKLKEYSERFSAENGSVIVMDPNTGEILAMADYPNFDPNKYSEAKDPKVYANVAIHDLYEPGSAFKPIAMAAALDTDAVEPDTTHQCGGKVDVQGYTIYTSTLQAHGTETMTQVLENSCNVGMVFVNQRLGLDKLYDYLDKFGFNSLTGIDLDTESEISMKSKDEWQEIDLATSGFGQGPIAITPIQLITAMSAIANEGKLMKPYIVKEIIHLGGAKEEIKPQFIRQVVSPSTATTLSAMMVSAVDNGFGRPAQVPHYTIAGKTGTAQVAKEDGSGYDPSQKITSFIGFGPVENPKFIMLIRFKNPQAAWAESNAAPMFSELAQELFNYYQVPPDR